MIEAGAYDAVWQFPVVLVPLSTNGNDESVILRPVNSKDGMTANFARLHRGLLISIAERIVRLPCVDAVYLDVSDKPPATIEWE
jgi:GMP synthase (glutamine-hydrolysing)